MSRFLALSSTPNQTKMDWNDLVELSAAYRRHNDDSDISSFDSDSDFASTDSEQSGVAEVPTVLVRRDHSGVFFLAQNMPKSPETPLDCLFSHASNLIMRGFPVSGPVLALPAPRPTMNPLAEIRYAELLQQAVQTYWTETHPMLPLLSKGVFERAISGSSQLYKERPLPLLYAIAANGIRHIWSVDAVARTAFMRSSIEKARDIILCRQTLDLSDLQALMLICNTLAVAGLGARIFPLLKRAALGAEALFFALDISQPPQTADDWIYREMVLRMRIALAGLDVSQAQYAGLPPVGSYFHPHQCPLPCAELFFEEHDYEVGFSRIKAASATGLPYFGISINFADSGGWGAVVKRVKAAVEATVCGYASVEAMFQMAVYMRSILIPILAAGNLDSARQDAALLASVADVPYSLFPQLDKDPNILFHSRESPFLQPITARVAAQSLLCMQGYAVDALIAGGFRNSAVQQSLRAAALIDAYMKDDPELAYCHFIVLTPVFTVGKLLLESISSELEPSPTRPGSPRFVKRGETIKAIRVCAKCLDLLGLNWGMQARRLAQAFDKLMTLAGILPENASSSLGRRSEELSEVEVVAEEGPEEGRSVFFIDQVLKSAAVEA